MKKSLMLSVFTLIAVGVTACGKTHYSADDQVLRVFATNAGYDIKWLEDSLEAFKNTEWVKEKYPKLKIEKIKNDASTIPGDMINSGEKVCSYDLVATCQPFHEAIYKGKNNFEDLSDIWNGAVPGDSNYDGSEGHQMKDKATGEGYNQEIFEAYDGSTSVYTIPWAKSLGGFVVNLTKFHKALGNSKELPRTTNEMIKICSDFMATTTKDKFGKNSDYALCFAGQAHYCEGPTQAFWAQYEGRENYYNYFKGIVVRENDEKERHEDSLKQQGKLEGLKVMEQIIGNANGFVDTTSSSQYDAFTPQYNFISGKSGIFCIIGDWFYNEAKKTFPDFLDQFEFQYMDYPVISSITEKCSSVKTDEILSQVVKCIDEDKSFEEAKTALSGVVDLSANDYEIIYNARHTHTRLGGHNFAVPSYAMFKEIAKDFLRFFATDECARIVTSNCVVTPWKFELNGELPNNYSKEVYRISQKLVDIKHESSFKTNYIGGLMGFKKGFVYPTFVGSSGTMTAQEFYDQDTALLTSSFKAMMKDSGY